MLLEILQLNGGEMDKKDFYKQTRFRIRSLFTLITLEMADKKLIAIEGNGTRNLPYKYKIIKKTEMRGESNTKRKLKDEETPRV